MKNGTAWLSEQWITEPRWNKWTWWRFTSVWGCVCGSGVPQRVRRIKVTAGTESLEAFFQLLHGAQCVWQLNRMQMWQGGDVYNLHRRYRVNHCPEPRGTWSPSDYLRPSAQLTAIHTCALCLLFPSQSQGMPTALCSLNSQNKKINASVKYIWKALPFFCLLQSILSALHWHCLKRNAAISSGRGIPSGPFPVTWSASTPEPAVTPPAANFQLS